MDADFVEFRRGVIAPMECIKEGWALIKDDYWLFFGIAIVGFLLGSVLPIILMGPMMVGVFLCFQARQRNQPVEFGMLFKGFDHFVAGLIATVLKMIPIFILMIPYYIFLIGVMAFSMPRGSHPSNQEQQQFMMSFFGFEIVFFLTIMVVSIAIEDTPKRPPIT